MSDLIEFKPSHDPDEPKLKGIRGRDNRTLAKPYCSHTAQLLINEDTQLVECSACGLVMSAYSALMLITKEWNRMKWDTTEWEKMRAEQEKARKEGTVRRAIKQLQWIEIPEESETEARRYWERLTEARGEPPYAMFRRRRGKHGMQYCVLDKKGGWTDADFLLATITTRKRLEKVEAQG